MPHPLLSTVTTVATLETETDGHESGGISGVVFGAVVVALLLVVVALIVIIIILLLKMPRKRYV